MCLQAFLFLSANGSNPTSAANVSIDAAIAAAYPLGNFVAFVKMAFPMLVLPPPLQLVAFLQ